MSSMKFLPSMQSISNIQSMVLYKLCLFVAVSDSQLMTTIQL